MKKGLSLRPMHKSFYQDTCRRCHLMLSIQSIVLLVCASASLHQLWPFILSHLCLWHLDLVEGVEHKKDVCSLHCFISRRIVHVGCYSLVMWSDFFGFNLACFLLSGLVVLSFGFSHAVRLVLLRSTVQNLLVFQGQYMLQQGGLGVQVETIWWQQDHWHWSLLSLLGTGSLQCIIDVSSLHF